MSVVANQLKAAIDNLESAATDLSRILEQFDLSKIPYCEKDLNTVDIGCKVKVAKIIYEIISKAS